MSEKPLTVDEIAAARNVLARLKNEFELSPSDVRRAEDGIRVLEDTFWSIEEGDPGPVPRKANEYVDADSSCGGEEG